MKIKNVSHFRYQQGQEINIKFILTSNHMGHAEFSICPLKDDNDVETEECFKKYPLTQLECIQPDNNCTNLPDKNKVIVRGNENIYRLKAVLPEDLSCDHCVLRWHYRAGNNMRRCPDGVERFGCGPQEIFRGCSDIRIKKGDSLSHRPDDATVLSKPTYTASAVSPKPTDAPSRISPEPIDTVQLPTWIRHNMKKCPIC